MNGRNENKILKSYSHGDTYALMMIAERFGIEQIMDDALKPQSRNGLKRSKSLLLIALQSVCNPSSKSEFESWVKSTTLPYEYNLLTESLIRNYRIIRTIRVHAILKKFLYAHSGFKRYDLMGYLNLFAFVTNPPDNLLEKVDLIVNIAFRNPKLLRFRDFIAQNTGVEDGD